MRHPSGLCAFSEEKKREFIRLRKEPLVNGGEPKDIAVPVAKTLIGPNASKEAFDKLVDSMSRLHKESYIKSIEATVMTDNMAKLGDIRAPTHVVVGGADQLTTPEMARELIEKIPAPSSPSLLMRAISSISRSRGSSTTW